VRPGEHTLKVISDGFHSVTQRVSISTGAEEIVRVSLLRDASSPLWQKPVEAVPTKSASAGSPPTWAWVVGGAGIVALGTAAAFGIDGLVTAGNLNRLCNGNVERCLTTGMPGTVQSNAINLLNSHKDRDLGLFTGFGIAGVMAVTVAAVEVASSRKTPIKRTNALVVSPIMGPRLGGVMLGGMF
jgi:hypothetical protein